MANLEASEENVSRPGCRMALGSACGRVGGGPGGQRRTGDPLEGKRQGCPGWTEDFPSRLLPWEGGGTQAWHPTPALCSLVAEPAGRGFSGYRTLSFRGFSVTLDPPTVVLAGGTSSFQI